MKTRRSAQHLTSYNARSGADSSDKSTRYARDFEEGFYNTSASAASTDAPEVLLNRYRIISLKNEGGFGVVYICWDTRLQRRVAIKVMPLLDNAFADDGFSEGTIAASTMHEALGEARASSNLTHPNIVTVHDFETDGVYAYLVMEYVDGLSLDEILTRVEGGVLLADEAAYVLQSLASAVEYAHENGVLHLDIKPSNVLIGKDGRVLLTDFGMAGLQSATGFADARGGTIGYMPPEQIEGRIVDERADIFSLATVAYQAITGTAPFTADSAEKSKKLIQKGPQPLGNVNVPLTGMVEDVLATALAADASERPIQAVEAFAPAIQYLGNPQAGRTSLVHLLRQTAEEDEPFNEDAWRSLGPLGRRLLWLPSLLARVANGFITGFFFWELLPLFGIFDSLIQTIVALVVLVAACMYAPIGAGLGLLALAVACFSCGIAPITILLALGLIALGSFWLLCCSRKSMLSATALLMGPLLKAPAVAPALSAYAFPPLSACITAFFSASITAFYNAFLMADPGSLLTATSSSATADALTTHVSSLLTSPGFWAFAGVCALSAGLASFVARFQTHTRSDMQNTYNGAAGESSEVSRAYEAGQQQTRDLPLAPAYRLVISQFLCFGGLLCALSLQAGLNANAIWGIPPLIPSVFGLVFCVVMSGVSVLFNLPRTLNSNRKGNDELS